ncbi:MAG: hypothetical protein QXF07_01010 [Candidatus Micrarchaeia archaeon]
MMENNENKMQKMDSNLPKKNDSKLKMKNKFAYLTLAVIIALTAVWVFGTNLSLPFISNLSPKQLATDSIAISEVNEKNNTVEFQEINMTVDNGWMPATFVVKAGVPVRWNVYVKRFGGCINGLAVRELGINYQFERSGVIKTFEFTPLKEGTIYFTCLMGMATGKIEIRNNITLAEAAAINAEAASKPIQRVGGCGCGSRNSYE